MYQRHNEVPVYQQLPASIPAEHYNQAMSSLRRRSELRLKLPKLQDLALILQRDALIVVDESLNDLPVLAWCDFASQRTNLHQPVSCTLRHYHTHADVLLTRVLEAMALLLGELDDRPDGPAAVLPFRSDTE